MKTTISNRFFNRMSVSVTLLLTYGNYAGQNSNTSFAGGNQLNISGFGNTVYGDNAFGGSTGSRNTLYGMNAMPGVIQGVSNCAFGEMTLGNNAGGFRNSAFGHNAGVAGPNMTNATAIGAGAIATTNNSIQLGDNFLTDVFVGVGTNAKLTTGRLQVTDGTIAPGNILVSDAFGNATWQSAPGPGGSGWSLSGNAGTVPGTNFIGTTDNVPLTFKVDGSNSGRIDKTTGNLYFGYEAGNSSYGPTGALYNLGLGYRSLANTLNENYGIAIGYKSMENSNLGDNNIGIGSFALQNSAQYVIGNIGLGYECLRNVAGFYNVAIGYMSSQYQTVGSNNISLGYMALRNSTSSDNVAIGSWGLINNTTGSGNNSLGVFATVGSANLTNATAIGYQTTVNASNKIRLGNAGVTVIEGNPMFYTGSDGRFKSNISESEIHGLDFIKLLRPVTYNFECKKFHDFLSKNLPDSLQKMRETIDFTHAEKIRRSGFIAQEVEAAATTVGYNFDGIHKPDNDDDNYSLSYASFVVPLVKAVQEQQVLIEELTAKLSALEMKQSTAISAESEISKNGNFSLSQNIPNPFQHESSVDYKIPHNFSSALLQVCDLSGKQLLTKNIKKSEGTIIFSANELGTGIFVYSLIVDGELLSSKKMVVTE